MARTKVLLVDDNPANLVALENLIAAPDVAVISASSGDEALLALLDQDFALALLDVQMPIISGFELARLMRNAQRSCHIPIIFVTASNADRATIFEGYDKGAVDFLLKPLDPHIVRSKVRGFVELSQKREKLREKLDEVERLRADADAANAAKSRFLANMSHEIRTPLNAVLGFADLLNDGDISPKLRQSYVDAITRNGKHLLRLVDDILDLSKIEADRLEIERTPIALAEFVSDIRAMFDHRAREKGVAFNVHLAKGLPQTLESDPVRLKQIVDNVVSNAIKFTDKGSVEVTLAMTGDVRPKLVIDVRDSGCGLDKEAVARLFEPFMQADSTTTRRYGGTGLGLSIARRLAKALGGNVDLLETMPGGGSRFRISIDPGFASAEPVEASPLSNNLDEPKGEAPLAGVNVLVVDDAEDNQLLVASILKIAGADTTPARDGKAAITLAMSGGFNIVLMDIQLPGMDGYEATAELRSLGYRGPVIACTASAMSEELDRCTAAGCNDYLSKPIDRQTLIDKVAKHAK